ncbi:MAG: hypothetical protein BRC57_05280 [Cyanobacteria bacterium QS_8_48_54]|nr:MAG: hypothetical protein BRC57_05280 [Cyanobacteria bacterium QS_8_48_54]
MRLDHGTLLVVATQCQPPRGPIMQGWEGRHLSASSQAGAFPGRTLLGRLPSASVHSLHSLAGAWRSGEWLHPLHHEPSHLMVAEPQAFFVTD